MRRLLHRCVMRKRMKGNIIAPTKFWMEKVFCYWPLNSQLLLISLTIWRGCFSLLLCMSWNISLISTFKSFPGQALDFLILSICSMLTWTLLMVRNASRSLLVGNHLSFYSTLRYWDYEKKEKEIWCLYKIDRPNLSHCVRGAFCLEMHQNDVFFIF